MSNSEDHDRPGARNEQDAAASFYATCPKCGHSSRAPAGLLGRSRLCQECGAMFEAQRSMPRADVLSQEAGQAASLEERVQASVELAQYDATAALDHLLAELAKMDERAHHYHERGHRAVGDDEQESYARRAQMEFEKAPVVREAVTQVVQISPFDLVEYLFHRCSVPTMRRLRPHLVPPLRHAVERASPEESDRFFERLFASGDDDDDDVVIELLGQLGSPPAVLAVCDRLLASPEVRSDVPIEALIEAAKVEPEFVVETLTQYLDDKNPSTRKAAAVTLGKIGTPGAAAALLARLGAADPVQEAAAAGLREGAGAPTQFLMEGLHERLANEDPRIRTAAVKALAGSTAKGNMMALMERLSDPSQTVAAAAREALSETRRKWIGEGEHEVKMAFVERLSDPSPTLVAAAREWLSDQQSGPFRDQLVMALVERMSDPAEAVVAAAREVLSEQPASAFGHEALMALVQRLSDPSEVVVAAARELLSEKACAGWTTRLSSMLTWALSPKQPRLWRKADDNRRAEALLDLITLTKKCASFLAEPRVEDPSAVWSWQPDSAKWLPVWRQAAGWRSRQPRSVKSELRDLLRIAGEIPH